MRFITVFIAFYLGAYPLYAQNMDNAKPSPTLNDSWTVFLGVMSPTSFESVPRKLMSPGGSEIAPITAQLKNKIINLGALAGKRHDADFKEKEMALLYNEFTCEKSGIMRLGISADWWKEVYVNGKKVLDLSGNGSGATYTPDDFVFDFPVKKGKNLLVIKVLSGSRGWRLICGVPTPSLVFKENSEWKKVDMSSLSIKEGSALDLSALTDAPAGKYGRAIVGTGGFLAFADQPSHPVRLFAFNGVPHEVWLNGNDSDFKNRARLFAKSVKRQGYSLIRLNSIEAYLCLGAKKDMTINPVFLDRWDFLLSELKKEGVYSQLVIMAYGLFSNDPWGEVFKQKDKHKLMMYLGGEWERARFRYGAETLFNHVNPYTGMAWKDDPAIALVEFYNEQENGIWNFRALLNSDPAVRALFERKWHDWLNAKFNGKPTPELLADLKGTAIANAPIPDPAQHNALANELNIFMMDLAKQSFSWCESIVRNIGYPGLITQENSAALGVSSVRSEFSPVTSVHSYFAHPMSFSNAGSKIIQTSHIERMANSVRGGMPHRIADRPLFVGEVNHAFWNQYQHEGGLVFSAYSSLQDFSSIAIHSTPVVLRDANQPIMDFTSGGNPVVRANEFLAACLFGRGDVKRAQHRVELQFPMSFINSRCNGYYYKTINSQQSIIALMTGFSISFPELPKPKNIPVATNADLILSPANCGTLGFSGWDFCLHDVNDNSFSLADTVAKMKELGILPASNISNPGKDIFQSDTGEIILRAKEKIMKVVTPKTEAISLEAGKSEELGLLKVNQSNIPACIAVCSVDNRALNTSEKIILIYNTEAANSGMEISTDRCVMRKIGTAPILLRCGKLGVTLKRGGAEKMSLYALGLDGVRRERLQLSPPVNGVLNINIDTANLKNGPTPFFELVRTMDDEK